MELYYAGYTVGWPVGLGETAIKTITTAGLKTIYKSKMKCVCSWKNSSKHKCPRKYHQTKSFAIAAHMPKQNAKNPQRGEKHIQENATRGTENQNETPQPKSTILEGSGREDVLKSPC